MKNVMVAIIVSAVVALGAGNAPGPRVMFWNLENYFDWRNDSTGVSDAEFSSRGARHWTRKRFQAKSSAVAKGILWAGAPEIIGLAEVENRFVLRQLIGTTALQKLDYEIVHYDSPDSRGIDVALLYRGKSLTLLDSKACHIYEDTTILATRDILLATFTDGEDRPMAILVNHHPSKYGGAEESETRRRMAVSALKHIVDSLQQAGIPRIVAIGDFNDTPDNAIYSILPMENLSLPLHLRGLGTIRYEGRWELIDLCFVSGMGDAALEILYIPFLMVPDRAHGGQKPLRTYSGPRYIGGVSDHCPILLQCGESKEK